MMLFLDSSDNETIRIALVNSNIKEYSWKTNKPSEDFSQKIQGFLKKSKISPNKLTKIAVVTGPGHFSRIRTAVATANALGFALNKPIIGLKQQTHYDLKKIFQDKGQKMVKVFYNRPPNITKPKKSHR